MSFNAENYFMSAYFKSQAWKTLKFQGHLVNLNFSNIHDGG